MIHSYANCARFLNLEPEGNLWFVYDLMAMLSEILKNIIFIRVKRKLEMQLMIIRNCMKLDGKIVIFFN